MGRKNKHTKEVKLKAILDYENGVKSIIQFNDINHASSEAQIS